MIERKDLAPRPQNANECVWLEVATALNDWVNSGGYVYFIQKADSLIKDHGLDPARYNALKERAMAKLFPKQEDGSGGAAAKNFCADAQPMDDNVTNMHADRRAQILGKAPSLQVVGGVKGGEDASGGGADGDRIVINPDNYPRIADQFLRRDWWSREHGMGTLQYWQGQHWGWNGQCWKPFDADSLNAKLRAFFERCVTEEPGKVGAARHEQFLPVKRDVAEVVDALKGRVHISPETSMPGWLGSKVAAPGAPAELISLKNGIYVRESRTLVSHTPRFWTPNGADFEYDSKAKAPRFVQWLEEVWTADPEAQQAVLEMIGLCFTDVTRYQKAWMFIGPKRGGRGTLGRLIKALIGKENFIGSNVSKLGKDFGLHSFIGKKAAVFPDVKMEDIPRGVLGPIMEAILNITGEDDVTVQRKGIGDWLGQLTCKMIFFGNEPLIFPDTTGAIPGRMITIAMTKSWAKNPDNTLGPKLIAERPGIFNLAMAALEELWQRGYLVQPGSGKTLSDTINEGASDVLKFTQDCCELGPEFSARVQDLYERWVLWCARQNLYTGWDRAKFSMKLRSTHSELRAGRPRQFEGERDQGRPTVMYGIKLAARGAA